MQRISSRLTVVYKRVFPAIWLAMIVVNVAFVAIAWPADSTHRMMAIATPILMAVFGYLIFRWLIFDLVDLVQIDDNTLVIGDERIPISDLEHVHATQFFNPERITLTVKGGRKIAFVPPARFHLFTRHPIAQELMMRMLGSRRI
jgi:hypothetical protein